MQDDLDDGGDWLVKQGIADPKRMCIVGSSSAGYAAMWGGDAQPRTLSLHGELRRGHGRAAAAQTSAKALEKAGKRLQYHVYPGEGHGLTNPDNRKDYFDRLEAFLAKHNPAD